MVLHTPKGTVALEILGTTLESYLPIPGACSLPIEQKKNTKKDHLWLVTRNYLLLRPLWKLCVSLPAPCPLWPQQLPCHPVEEVALIQRLKRKSLAWPNWSIKVSWAHA